MEKLKRILKGRLTEELLLYVVFGVLTTLVSIGAYWLFNTVFEIHYAAANVLSWIIAVTFAFFTNRSYVFKSESKNNRAVMKEMLMFYVARLFSLGVEELGLFVLIDLLHRGETISKIALQFVVIVLNYVLSKLVVFKKK